MLDVQVFLPKTITTRIVYNKGLDRVIPSPIGYLFRSLREADFPKPRYYWVSGNRTSFYSPQILTLAKVLTNRQSF